MIVVCPSTIVEVVDVDEAGEPLTYDLIGEEDEAL